MNQAFLSAILADPADNLSRSAYADWLMEQDYGPRLRGEFIMAQLEVDRLLRECERAGPCSCAPITIDASIALCERCLWLSREGVTRRLNEARDLEKKLFHFATARGQYHIPEATEVFAILTKNGRLGIERFLPSGPRIVLFHERGFVHHYFGPLDYWIIYGAHLVAKNPITYVSIPGLKPQTQTSVSGQPTKFLLYASQLELPHHIGDGLLWGAMLPKETKQLEQFEYREYDSEQAALDAVSEGCLLLAHLAGGKRP